MNNQLFKILGACLLLIFSVGAYAQSRSVTGMVVDGKSQPVIGAVVKEMGASNGAITGADGSFSINTTTASPVLEVSFVGFTTQKIEVGNRSSVRVTLAEGEELRKVVVTAQNQKREARSLGYAITSVSAKDLTEGADRSVLNSMQGKVAGVEISAAGSNPGASTRIVIRGPQSISQGNQPLIVIDGVPMTNSSTGNTSLNGGFDFGNGLNAVNPDDIEDIQILKGSSASALYGSRAANGVIMITTKKGSRSKSGKKAIGVSLNFAATYSDPLKLPTLQNTYGQGWSGNDWLDENGSWGPIFDGKDRVYGRAVDNSQLLAPYSALENNVKDFFERGSNYMTSVGINGGGENSTFYASFSNVNQDGIIPTNVDRYDRNTISFRGSQDFGKLQVSASVNIANTNSEYVLSGQQENSVYRNILDIPRNMSVVDMANYKDKFYNIEDYFTPYGVTNPYWALNENGNEYDASKFFGGLETTLDLATNLKGLYRFGYDIENNDIHRFEAKAEPVGPNNPVSNPGLVADQTIGRKQFNHDFNIIWDKDINSLVSLDFLGGLNLNERSTSSLASSVSSIDIDGFYNLSNSAATPVVSRDNTLRRLVGLYGIMSASYKDFLYASVSARNDWSSTLPVENNSFFYPSANVSLVFTDIMSTPTWLNFGKLRAGFGRTGNDAGVYSIQSVFNQASYDVPFQSFDFPLASGINGFGAGNQIGNSALTPEITDELEIGTDLRLYDGRINVDLTYYNRLTNAQIISVPLDPSTGYSVIVSNAAKVKNNGIEALVSYRVLRREKGFNWTTSANYTRNRNEVVELDDAVDKVSLGGLSSTGFFALEGQPIGVFEGPSVKRTDDGKVVVGSNGVPVVADDKELQGNAQRDYILGFRNNFSYKQFSLGVLFDVRKGGRMYSHTASLIHWTGHAAATTYNDRKPFIVPNSVKEAGQDENGDPIYVENDVPVAPSELHEYHTAEARDAQFVIDKSYTKLREVVLTYRLPSSYMEKMPFAGASISLVGRNLFIWTPVENQFIDPEVTTFGNGNQAAFGEFGANPTTRSYGFTLNFNF